MSAFSDSRPRSPAWGIPFRMDSKSAKSRAEAAASSSAPLGRLPVGRFFLAWLMALYQRSSMFLWASGAETPPVLEPRGPYHQRLGADGRSCNVGDWQWEASA